MKRGFISLVLAVTLLGSVFGAAAQDTNTLRLTGHSDNTMNREKVVQGSDCNIVGPAGFPRQVIVRDESDIIVAAWSIEGTWEAQEGRDFLACTWDTAIDVPDATFYTVFLEEERLLTLSAAELRGPKGNIDLILHGD